MDLGECPKVHDLALRADYEAASKQKDYFYDVDVSINNTIGGISSPIRKNSRENQNSLCRAD